MENEEIEIAEFGIAYESSKTFFCEKSFMLRTINGPLIEVRPGQKVRLGDRLGPELFYANKVVPLLIGELFEVVVTFQIVNKSGEFENVNQGDVVKLERSEAIKLLKEGKVKEKIERPK